MNKSGFHIAATSDNAQLAEYPVVKSDNWTIIHAGALMPRADQPALKNASVIGHNDKIDSVRMGSVRPKDLAGVTPARITSSIFLANS